MHAIEPLMERAERVATLVDTHVHLHPAFDTGLALDHAVRNLAAGAAQLGVDGGAGGVLMLAETPGDRTEERLAALARGVGRWTAQILQDGRVCRARRSDGATIFLVRGRQVPTRERLEVLALGTTEPFPERPPLGAAIRRADELGALAVIPWGFGKWWLRRGRRVREALASGAPVVLGDNGGRLEGSLRPRAFDLAAERGIPVLPGSDPLPLERQERRVGAYGLALPGTFDPRQPVALLLERLRGLTGPPQVFGRRTPLPRFLWHQLAMQVRRGGSP